MNNEIYQAISAYHIANQGDDRQEIEDTEQEYQLMKLVHGEQAVKDVMDYYNETVIRKSRQCLEKQQMVIWQSVACAYLKNTLQALDKQKILLTFTNAQVL